MANNNSMSELEQAVEELQDTDSGLSGILAEFQQTAEETTNNVFNVEKDLEKLKNTKIYELITSSGNVDMSEAQIRAKVDEIKELIYYSFDQDNEETSGKTRANLNQITDLLDLLTKEHMVRSKKFLDSSEKSMENSRKANEKSLQEIVGSFLEKRSYLIDELGEVGELASRENGLEELAYGLIVTQGYENKKKDLEREIADAKKAAKSFKNEVDSYDEEIIALEGDENSNKSLTKLGMAQQKLQKAQDAWFSKDKKIAEAQAELATIEAELRKLKKAQEEQDASRKETASTLKAKEELYNTFLTEYDNMKALRKLLESNNKDYSVEIQEMHAEADEFITQAVNEYERAKADNAELVQQSYDACDESIRISNQIEILNIALAEALEEGTTSLTTELEAVKSEENNKDPIKKLRANKVHMREDAYRDYLRSLSKKMDTILHVSGNAKQIHGKQRTLRDSLQSEQERLQNDAMRFQATGHQNVEILITHIRKRAAIAQRLNKAAAQLQMEQAANKEFADNIELDKLLKEQDVTVIKKMTQNMTEMTDILSGVRDDFAEIARDKEQAIKEAQEAGKGLTEQIFKYDTYAPVADKKPAVKKKAAPKRKGPAGGKPS